MRGRNGGLQLAVLLVPGLLALVPTTAVAGPILLDQQVLAGTDVSGFAIIPQQSVSQTFTAARSGLLSFIDVSLYRQADTVGDVILSLLTVPLDISTAVFSTSIPIGSVPVDKGAFVKVSVANARVTVNPGDVWAIHLSRTSGTGGLPWVIWNFASQYAGGAAFPPVSGQTFADVAFRTFVDVGTPGPVPEPTSLLLLGTGSMGLAWKARHRRRSLASSDQCV